MDPTCAASLIGSTSQIASKKRPSPTNDCAAAPAKRRTGSIVAPQLVVPEITTVAPETRQQALEREMRTLFEVEYQEEVISYMHEMDSQTRPVVETIDLQPELQWYMRPYLIDFMVEIHQQYRLRPETLYLAVNIVDRYVSKRVVFKKHYQLVGCAALWIAAKFEDAKERVPSVGELGTMCCGAYEESSFIQMEGHVLSTIGWQLGHPTAEAWLRLFSIGAHRAHEERELETASTGHLARFIMELSLFHRSYVGLKSADVAAAALVLSRHILGKPRRASDETEAVIAVVRLMDSHLGEHMATVSGVVMKKYSHVHFSRASSVVKEWYDLGHRFAGPTTLLAPAPALISRGVHQSLPALPTSASTTSLSTVSSSRSAQLTPGSMSSLSLESSPTSSVSSLPSYSACSPSSFAAEDEDRENKLMCSPRIVSTRRSHDAGWAKQHEETAMGEASLDVSSVSMSRH